MMDGLIFLVLAIIVVVSLAAGSNEMESKHHPEGKRAAQTDEPVLSPISFCGRCGKRLHGTTAIARGYGPHCWAIVTGLKQPPPGKRPHFAHSRLLQTTERG